MDAIITPDFVISFAGGAFVCALIIQFVKKALKNFVKPKMEELVKFIELVIVSGVVSMVWQQAIEGTETLNDQLTFGVRWLVYMAASHLIYRWLIKKWMPDLGEARSKDPE